jgi:hypothetical protein
MHIIFIVLSSLTFLCDSVKIMTIGNRFNMEILPHSVIDLKILSPDNFKKIPGYQHIHFFNFLSFVIDLEKLK